MCLFIHAQAYATLLNCWKFLRASSYQVEKGNLYLNGLYYSSQSNFRSIDLEDMVIIDEDVTMDNQQPSPIIIDRWLIGCRSQTKMAVGNFSYFWRDCLRYSRADYLRKLIRLEIKLQTRNMQIYSPFRRWTCGRIINTYPRYQPTENSFSSLPLQQNELAIGKGIEWDRKVSLYFDYTYLCACVLIDNCICWKG